MTEKEMMLFAYQQSPEPMIKNKVLRDALDKDLGPRNMAQGGRIGYADKNAGKLVKKLDKANTKRKMDSVNELYEKYGKEYVDKAAREWAEMSNLEVNRKNKLKVQNFDLIESGDDRSTFKRKFKKDIEDFKEWNPDRRSKKNIKNKLYPSSSTSNKMSFRSRIFDALGRKDSPNYDLSKLKAMQKNFAEYDLLKTYLYDNFGIVTALDHPLDKATIETIMNASSKDLINVNILEQNLNTSFKKTLNNKYRQAMLDGNLNQKRAVETIAKKFNLNIGSVPDNQFKTGQVGPFELNKIDKGVGSFETLNIKDEMLKSLKNASTLDTEWGDYIKNNPDVFKEAGIDLKKLKKPKNVENITKNLPKIEKQINKFAQRMMSFCPVGSKRVKRAGGGGAGPTCSMEEAQAGLKKQVDAAAKASKNGKIPKRFGKLRSFLTFAFGIADVPIETLLALPRITAGNYEAAVDGSLGSFLPEKVSKFIWGVDNSGAFDLEKLKDTDPKVYQYLKDKQAQEEYTEAIATMDELYPFLDKAQAEGTLDKVNPEVLEQYRNAKKKSESIIDEYEEYGYVEESSDTPLTGKLAFQKYLRDKVKSDFERRQDKIQTRADKDYEQSGLVFDKDPNKKEIKYEDRYTAPTDLKSFIDQKGELGKKSNFLEYSVRDEADRIGESNIFDNYIQGADNKDERDLYSELPIEYANQLAALEKEELNQGLKSKGKFNTRSFKDFLESQQMDTDELYAQGGLASLKRKL
jgi:hypothetical protein